MRWAYYTVLFTFATEASAGQSTTPGREARDRAAVEEFHRLDIAATLKNDTAALVELIDENVVSLGPETGPVIGRPAVRELLEKSRAAASEFEAGVYQQDWNELVIAGDYAFEWGYIRSSVRNKSNGERLENHYKALRILKRSDGGHWRVFRVMWNRAPTGARDGVSDVVVQIRTADYEGDRAALRRLYVELERYLKDEKISARIRYWRGFALWRRALNGFNDSAPKGEIAEDLRGAIAEFDAGAETDPKFADAKIGAMSCLMNLAFLNGAETNNGLIRRAIALARDVRELDPDNPRFLWVSGASAWWTPPAQGGSQAKAMEIYERGLRSTRARKPPEADGLDPDWGEPELLMNLAWSNLNRKEPDIEAAEQYAQEALRLVPNWHYLRDILLPQIQKARVH